MTPVALQKAPATERSPAVTPRWTSLASVSVRPTDQALLRIGEFCRRAGVTPERLRAWERRFGFPSPARSEGGFRLYEPGDVDAVVAVRQAGERGVSTAEAIETVRGVATPTIADAGIDWTGLRAALDVLDGAAAHAEIDRLLATLTVRSFLARVILPYLHEVGERWAAGSHSIAQEHFASNLIRGRLLGLARSWETGTGPLAVLACPSGEQHDLALIMFGIALREQGWRIVYLGQDTPLGDVAQLVETDGVTLVVVATRHRRVLADAETELRRIAASAELVIAGPGADAALAEAIGAMLVEVDPLAAADLFPARRPTRRAR